MNNFGPDGKHGLCRDNCCKLVLELVLELRGLALLINESF